jgi:hypothetical protein
MAVRIAPMLLSPISLSAYVQPNELYYVELTRPLIGCEIGMACWEMQEKLKKHF